MDHFYALIMAGGGGTRLWPMSRKTSPKQMLPLIDDDTMFKTSIKRLTPLFTPDRIYIVTGPDYVNALREDVPEIPPENFIVEPYGKDTAPAAGLAISVIHKRDPQATVAILTADHYISKRAKFREVLSVAHDLAEERHIVTLGISPSYPATGFGYIRQGDQIKEIEGEVGDYICYKSLGFREKPDVVRATQFLASGDYTWNSGMFIWKAEQAMEEFQRQRPQIHQLLVALQETVDTPDYDAKLKEIWEEMPKISIDFAIMEGANNMAVIPVDIGWSDVGSWSSLFDVLKQDSFGNCSRGKSLEDRIMLDTRDTLVISKRLAVTIGVRDMIVVDTDDALLICHRDRAQEVKDVVNFLKANDNTDYL